MYSYIILMEEGWFLDEAMLVTANKGSMFGCVRRDGCRKGKITTLVTFKEPPLLTARDGARLRRRTCGSFSNFLSTASIAYTGGWLLYNAYKYIYITP